MSEQAPWHRYFGMSWMSLLHGRPATVEMEKDLTVQEQRLDVLVLRKEGELGVRLPDGFEPLAPHNLITFKSYRDTLGGRAMNELIGHLMAYQKLVSPSTDDLLPDEHFRLFAVCVRSPRELRWWTGVTRVSEGVYEAPHYTGFIRIIVVHELPQQEQNAVLHLFSAKSEMVEFGIDHARFLYGIGPVLRELLLKYKLEGAMPNALEELAQKFYDEVAKELPEEKRLELARELSEEKRLELARELPTEKRLEGIAASDRLKGLPVEELLAAIPPEVREELLRRARGPAAPPDAK